MKATAFFGESDLKAAVLRQLHEHRRLDEIAQGVYWEKGRGCHLGCLTHSDENAHQATERMFGIPLRVAYWLESVFENLPAKQCGPWVTDSIEAIPVGADLSLAHYELCYWLLGPDGPNTITKVNRQAIEHVRELHDISRRGGSVTQERWSAAESAAWSAAWSARPADWSAAWSARSAAWSAGESARSAAMSAAWSARSADWSAGESARSAAWEKIAAKSIEIFASAPVTECEQCEQQIEETRRYLRMSLAT